MGISLIVCLLVSGLLATMAIIYILCLLAEEGQLDYWCVVDYNHRQAEEIIQFLEERDAFRTYCEMEFNTMLQKMTDGEVELEEALARVYSP